MVLLMLKFSLKTRQNQLYRKHARVGNDTENLYAYYSFDNFLIS